MARDLTSQMQAAIAATLVRPALFVTGTFRTSPVYVWTGYGNIVWNGHTWTGIGTLGGISVIEEGSTVEARGVTLTLGGFEPTLLSEVMTEFQLKAPAAVYFGAFDDAGALIPDPVAAFVGTMDQPTVQVNGQTASIAINCENRLLDLQLASGRRLTNDDQQLDHPGDRGLEFVNAIQEMDIYWGRTPFSPNNR